MSINIQNKVTEDIEIIHLKYGDDFKIVTDNHVIKVCTSPSGGEWVDFEVTPKNMADATHVFTSTSSSFKRTTFVVYNSVISTAKAASSVDPSA